METTPNTFIPHEDNNNSNNRLGNILILISVIVLVVSIVLGGGSYLFRKNQEVQTKKHEDALTRSKERFSTGIPIRTLQQFDIRLKTSKELLAKHKSFTGLFDLIERITLKDVQFTAFSYYEVDNTKKNVVKLSGRAPDYKTIAEQSEQFSNDEEAKRYITDVIFSDLAVDVKDTGLVTFEVTFQVDSEFLMYNRYLNLPLNKTTPSSVDITNPATRPGVPNIQSQ